MPLVADALVIPGRLYGPGAPLLMYTGEVAARRGASVHRHSWTGTPPTSERDHWVRTEIEPVLEQLGGTPLLIGKSLGTYAASLAAERSLPAIWLTPLLTPSEAPDAAFHRATAPFLLVGGTADPAWDGTLARRLTPHVLEIDDADHGLYVPGPLTDSIAVLAHVVIAVEQFLTAIRWP